MSTAPHASLLTLTLEGHLSAGNLHGVTAPVAVRLAGQGPRCGLIVDARRMTGYDTEARTAFVSWIGEHRSRLLAIAILTSNTVWRMVIGAMALASGTRMKPFAEPGEAEAWLHEQCSAEPRG